MIIDWSKIRIFLRPGITDMRKQINGLAALVEELGYDPFAESLYLFCGKDRRRLKALYWDRNGHCLWTKRLERDKYPWPVTREEVREISMKEFMMLLQGIDFFHAHQRLVYRSVT
jgi:transposase